MFLPRPMTIMIFAEGYAFCRSLRHFVRIRLASENRYTSCATSNVSVLYREDGSWFALMSRAKRRRAIASRCAALSSSFLNRGRISAFLISARSDTGYTICSHTHPEKMRRFTLLILFSLRSFYAPNPRGTSPRGFFCCFTLFQVLL